jgi:eukaryotic-like serine/threonine-protein kinase
VARRLLPFPVLADAAQSLGRYRLLTTLGRGGMAELHLGELTGAGGFSKLVAIKRILPHLAGDQHFVDMFLNEARIAARLSHPNICQVHELAEAGGEIFMVMEYLDGVSWAELARALPRGDGSELRLIAGVFCQVAEGLHHAHALRAPDGRPTPIVHRDVSPQNLFVTLDGVAKVLDFGVSKMLTDGPRTRAGTLKGKVAYMAPEQIRGDSIDGRADVFSLGVVLWEALTGARLFEGATDYRIWQAVMEAPIPPVSSIRREHAALDPVVARALNRDPDRRHSTMRALADDLRAATAARGGALAPEAIGEAVRDLCAGKLSARARRSAEIGGPGRPPSEPTLVAAATASVALRSGSIARERRSPRRRLALGAIALVVAGAGVARALSRGRDDDEVPAMAGGPRSSPHLARVAAKGGPRPASWLPGRRPGYLLVESTPPAVIFIDGVRSGETPLARIALAPGPHALRAVLADGRERSFSVEIAPAQTRNEHLSW